jgi:hypothetical protein
MDLRSNQESLAVGPMNATEEDLPSRITQFKKDINRPILHMMVGLVLCLVSCLALAFFAQRNALLSGAWPYIAYIVWVIAAGSLVFPFRFDRQLKALHRRHKLLCSACGNVVGGRGWKQLLDSRRCRRCGTPVS